MKISENGVVRDMTPEEEAKYTAEEEAHQPVQTLEDRLQALEEELAAAKILLGVDE